MQHDERHALTFRCADSHKWFIAGQRQWMKQGLFTNLGRSVTYIMNFTTILFNFCTTLIIIESTFYSCIRLKNICSLIWQIFCQIFCQIKLQMFCCIQTISHFRCFGCSKHLSQETDLDRAGRGIAAKAESVYFAVDYFHGVNMG